MHLVRPALLSSGSIYSTLAVAIERYIRVCRPLTSAGPASAASEGRLKGAAAVAGLMLFSIAFNICRFMELETQYQQEVGGIFPVLRVAFRPISDFD